MKVSRRPVAALAAVGLALLIAGCGGSRSLPTEVAGGGASVADPAFGSGFYDPPAPSKNPAGAAPAAYYPLASGNRWHYRRTFIVYEAGETAPPYVYEAEVEHLQTCPVTIAGREYLTERHRELGPYNTYLSWIRFRQTPRALFEADISIMEPSCETFDGREPANSTDPIADAVASWDPGIVRATDEPGREALERARTALLVKLDRVRTALHPGPTGTFSPPGGPPDGELMRLRYPLMPGLRWVIRSAPFRFEATVEAAETLDLPAGHLQGWRIRYDTDLFGPRDRVVVWYGPQGYLKHRYRLESVATDAQGQPVGTLVSEELMVLDGYALAGHGKRFEAAVP